MVKLLFTVIVNQCQNYTVKVVVSCPAQGIKRSQSLMLGFETRTLDSGLAISTSPLLCKYIRTVGEKTLQQHDKRREVFCELHFDPGSFTFTKLALWSNHPFLRPLSVFFLDFQCSHESPTRPQGLQNRRVWTLTEDNTGLGCYWLVVGSDRAGGAR